MADTEAPEMSNERKAHQDSVLARVDEAFAIRQRGNDAFKEGDMKTALRHYYTTLLNLKGLDTSIIQAFPRKKEPILPPTPADAPPADIVSPASQKSVTASTSKSAASMAEEDDLGRQIKLTIAITYTNMSACHSKLEKWDKALYCAQQALANDDKNRKAKFREALARIGLGEIAQGRRILEDLDKDDSTGTDASIKQALKNLDAKEKERDKKAKEQFKGFLNNQKAPAAQAASESAKATAPPVSS